MAKFIKIFIVIIIVCLIIVGIGYFITKPFSKRSGTSALAFPRGLPWLNVPKPLTLKKLHGKVVILDFWTYGCINCIHVIPDLQRLEKKYGNKLVVVGVHSPKFENEKNLGTLRKVIMRYGITHPIVQDEDHKLWNAYGVIGWPTQIVIDPQGNVVGSVVGEGHYNTLNHTVARLLNKYKDQLNTKPIAKSPIVMIPGKNTLAAPGKIAVSPQWVAISDTLHNRIILTDHNGKIQRIFGGFAKGMTDGNAQTARFSNPQGLVFFGNTLYVADLDNSAIRAIDLTTNKVSTIAAKSVRPWFSANTIISKRMNSPWGLAFQQPYLYIAMAGNHQIYRLDTIANTLQLLAGNGREGIIDGPAYSAEFSQPSGLSIADHWLFVADAEDSAVRRINLKTLKVSTLIGRGLFIFGDKDGQFNQALLQHVLGVAAKNVNQVYITDTYNHKLKLLELTNKNVVTLAGTGKPGKGSGPALKSQLNEPGGLALFGNNVLIADTNNNRILLYKPDDKTLMPWPLTQ